MRLGFDVSKALAPRDGIGRYGRELLRALILQASEDDEILLWGAPEDLGAEALRHQLGGLPASCRPWPGGSPHEVPDLFHATTWSLPPGLRCPLVFTCYDLTFLTHPELHTLENKIHCLTGLLQARLADATFLAISKATAETLATQLAVPAERTRVIYPAPASDLVALEPSAAHEHLKNRFDLAEGYVLAVGTLEPRKNLSRLLEAHEALDADLRRAHPLVIAGGGGWKNEELLEHCNGRDGVRLLGEVDDDNLAALYGAAALFAYPSLAEGFGLPVVEAMRCGAPVVTSNLSSLPEVAGNAARLVDPVDTEAIHRALDELLRDKQAREELRARGRDRAGDFSWAEAASETWKVYRRVVTEHLSDASPAA